MRRAVLLAAPVVIAALTCARVRAGEETIHLVDAPGHDVTASGCVTCHSLDYITMNAAVMSRSSWEKTVHKMIDKFGAPIRQEDVAAILDYLTAHYSG
jgi:sulfite dehydrogenase (cytochrome) subunit B